MTARILIIAGSDSGGGAGIQADIKTVTMLGHHAMTAITAITAQNTIGVQAIHAVPTDIVAAQIRSVISDIGVDAIKIGMLGAPDLIRTVRDTLEAIAPDVPIVLDPVLVATSGDALVGAESVSALLELAAIAAIVTPNLPELDAIGGADAVLATGAALLIKGGHGDGEVITDRLLTADGEIARWDAPRIATTSTHGTGCTLASAIATGLAQGLPIEPAVGRARDFVRLALHGAPGLGKGHGPMGQQAVRNDGLFTGPALNQVTLGATDYAASVSFYKLLGLTQIVDSPGNGYARFEAANGTTLSIHCGEAVSGATIYFESGALDGWCAYLARKGARIDQWPRDEDWGWREARLRDPAGNAVCLYQAAEYRRFPPWRL